MVPEGEVTFRSDILNSLTSAPLQHGTFVLFALAVVVAAGLGLAVMLLELALGAAEREVTLARLATMGLDDTPHKGKPEARPVLLGREEVLEGLLADACVHSHAGVRDGETDPRLSRTLGALRLNR